jgi:pyridoxal biosynthesis lyase PdxS
MCWYSSHYTTFNSNQNHILQINTHLISLFVVMALEKIPADIRAAGGVARMADPKKIKEIKQAVTIPVMAKCRIGNG